MQQVTGGDETGDGSGDGSGCLQDGVFSKSDELTLTFNENQQPELLLQPEQNYDQEIDSDSSLTLNSLPEGVVDPSPEPVIASVTTKSAQLTQQSQPASESAEITTLKSETVSKEKVVSPEPLKIGDSVIVDCPGLKHHNNQGVVVRLKTERFQGKELLLADLNSPGELRYVEVQLSWCRVMPETETGG